VGIQLNTKDLDVLIPGIFEKYGEELVYLKINVDGVAPGGKITLTDVLTIDCNPILIEFYLVTSALTVTTLET